MSKAARSGQPRGVAITGVGVVSPLGIGVDANWRAHAAGVSGIVPNTAFPSEGFPALHAGLVKDFNPRDHLPDRKAIKLMDRQTQLAVAASGQAIKAAGKDALEAPDRAGLYVASGYETGALEDILPMFEASRSDDRKGLSIPRLLSEGREEWSPLAPLRTLPNMPLAHTAISWGIRGPNRAFSPSATQGVQALASARNALLDGVVDVAVVGATDAPLNPFVVGYLSRLNLLSSANVHRPYSPEADGMLLGEGAVFFVLEETTRAYRRGAKVLGRLGAVTLGMEFTTGHAAARSPGIWKRTVERAVEESGWAAREVDELWPDGRSVPRLDLLERKALAATALNQATARTATPGTGYMGPVSPLMSIALSLGTQTPREPIRSGRRRVVSIGMDLVGQVGAVCLEVRQ